MQFRLKTRAGATVAACVALGAAGGIVGAMAAPAKHRSTSAATTTAPGGPPPRLMMRLRGGPPVHSEEVRLDKAGKAFITETEDNGTVKSISGNDVTITEAANGVTYKDVAVTVPGDATVYRNDAAAKAGDLKAGDRIHVSQSSDGTFVFATDSTFRPQRGHDWHGGPGGPDGPDGPGGPGFAPPPAQG